GAPMSEVRNLVLARTEVSQPPRSVRPRLAALDAPASPVRCFGRLIADSPRMQEVFNLLVPIAKTDITVTLLGETGTGKDVLAHTLHDHSARARGPFVVFDCGAVAASLAESELLGHERGSFTGAVAGYAGAYERAHGGTLFLDEIGELPLDLQPRLLRVLESRRVRRVGGAHDRAVDVRVVAATNRDLAAEVHAGRFRQDLYFRLAGVVIPVPPLRERLEDLPLLVPHLLEDLGGADLQVSDETYTALRAHYWPGNVRELKNALSCALAFVQGSTLEPQHLHLCPQSEPPPRSEDLELEHLALAGLNLQRVERATIKQTLAQTHGNRVLAARSLGIAASTLYEKLKKYSL
ncbi:MAG TPA: sigma-54 dependent transcriptional regulator, partial [Polyangiaceae bacterium]|nr:sigma-54 dependent transcriptional regulator [Polyangiaceae bacterium]